MHRVGGVYVEEVSKEHDWPVGTRCKAKYSADNLWYFFLFLFLSFYLFFLPIVCLGLLMSSLWFRYHAQIVELVAGGKFVARFLPLSCFQRASGHARIRYVVEFVDYSEKQMTDKEHVRVPKSEQVYSRDVYDAVLYVFEFVGLFLACYSCYILARSLLGYSKRKLGRSRRASSGIAGGTTEEMTGEVKIIGATITGVMIIGTVEAVVVEGEAAALRVTKSPLRSKSERGSGRKLWR
jgi:hypothetical protein